MDLLLWRHAEAEDGIPDSEHKLTPRGEKQARRMATWLKAYAPGNMRIVVSPAKRCQQTAEALGLPFETDLHLGVGNSVADLLAAVHWPDGGNERRSAVLIVGHQPTLGQTAAQLLSGRESSWSIKKGAVWWLTKQTTLSATHAELRLVIAMAPEFV